MRHHLRVTAMPAGNGQGETEMAKEASEGLDPNLDDGPDPVIDDDSSGAEQAATAADDSGDSGGEEWSKQAYLDEKRKRQSLEQQLYRSNERLAHIEGRLEALGQAKTQPEEEDYGDIDYGDLPGSVVRIAKKVAARELKAREGTRGGKDDWRKRASESIELARMKYDDFDAVYQKYLELEVADPRLAETVMTKSNPAEWAYHYVKTQTKKSDNGEVARLKKELEELKAQLGGSTKEERKTIAGTPGAGARPAPGGFNSDQEAFDSAFPE